MAFQTVFACEGCGNLYQSRVQVNFMSGSTAGYVHIPNLGKSDPYALDLRPIGPHPAKATTVERMLCSDCAAAVERAISEALGRR